MAITVTKLLQKMGYDRQDVFHPEYRRGEILWTREDKNGKITRRVFVTKTDITMYGSSQDVFLTKMSVQEFMELAA